MQKPNDNFAGWFKQEERGWVALAFSKVKEMKQGRTEIIKKTLDRTHPQD